MIDGDLLQPNPPDVGPVKGPRIWLWLASIVTGAILAFAAFAVPIPAFFALLPGPVEDVEDLVRITDARSYESEGSLFLTTVSVDDSVTFSEIVGSWFDDNRHIVSREAFTAGQSNNDFAKQQRLEMKNSKQNAREVALAALGFGRPEGKGARVEATLDDSPAQGVLREGDVIVEIDGEEVGTTCDVGRAIDQHEVGDEVEVVVRRNGELKTFELDTVKNPLDPTTPIVGISMTDVGYAFDPGVEVDIETGEIGGPSAGLMFALAVYDRLTPGDLTGGRKIAGTGTIECDGGVGPIGSIELKVAGAQQKGAEVFFAPQVDVEAAESVESGIDVVAVSTFDEAVEYLEGLD